MKKYFFLILTGVLLLSCSKDDSPRVQFGQMTITRADMNDKMWGTFATSDIVLIFNSSGDVVDRLVAMSGNPTRLTIYYRFESNGTILRYNYYQLPAHTTSKEVILEDGTRIPAGSPIPGLKTEYFFQVKTNDADLYFEFDANREVQANMLAKNQRSFLYALTPQQFEVRISRPDIDAKLPSSQYAMQPQLFWLSTDAKLHEKLSNGALWTVNSYAEMQKEHAATIAEWQSKYEQ